MTDRGVELAPQTYARIDGALYLTVAQAAAAEGPRAQRPALNRSVKCRRRHYRRYRFGIARRRLEPVASPGDTSPKSPGRA